MGLAVLYSRALSGMEAALVTVEVHLANGLPQFTIVGLPETEVKESKDRVRAALQNCQFEFPARRITVNLAPADLPKESGRFDLPIALGILAASGQIPANKLNEYEFAGELALTGELRAIRGALAMTYRAADSGRAFILPAVNAAEAALVEDAVVYPAQSLLQVAAHLTGRDALTRQLADTQPVAPHYPDMREVKGQTASKRALEIAAAGGHSVLLSGPPGVGKSMFARALCNTLQLPLLATSVARWLEPSNLGDVLKRMKRTFAEAEAQKPCILFVDEFDGIGRRVDLSRDYADYWNSVVNCCLELLDGAARTSGVIVVCATNNPSVIDAALLRSGRIDRQIEILLPDAEARLAILRHHLGRDIETVTASVSKAVLVENDLRKVLEEGFEMMSDKPYATLVQAAIPIRTEASRP